MESSCNRAFEMGVVYYSPSVAHRAEKSSMFSTELIECLGRYRRCDFSEMKYQEDVETNLRAIEEGDGRIMSSYETSEGTIWIITEGDRSATTILFPEEY